MRSKIHIRWVQPNFEYFYRCQKSKTVLLRRSKTVKTVNFQQTIFSLANFIIGTNLQKKHAKHTYSFKIYKNLVGHSRNELYMKKLKINCTLAVVSFLVPLVLLAGPPKKNLSPEQLIVQVAAHKSNTDSFKFYSRLLEAHPNYKKPSIIESKLNYYRAFRAATVRDIDSAKYFIHKSIDIAKELNDSAQLSICYQGAYNVYVNNSLYAEAARYLTLHGVYNPNMTGKSLSNNYMGLSHLYYYSKEYQKAVDYGLQALEIRKELNDTTLLQNSYLNLARFEFARKNWEKHKEYFAMAEKLYSTYNNPTGYFTYLEFKAFLHLTKKEYAEANEVLEELNNYANVDSIARTISYNYYKGDFYVGTNQIDKALQAYETYLSYSNNIRPVEALFASQRLDSLYFAQGDYAKFLKHKQLTQVLQDSVLKMNMHDLGTNVMAVIDSYKATQKASEALVELQNEKQSKSRLLVIGAFVLLTTLSIGLILFFRIQRNKLQLELVANKSSQVSIELELEQTKNNNQELEIQLLRKEQERQESEKSKVELELNTKKKELVSNSLILGRFNHLVELSKMISKHLNTVKHPQLNGLNKQLKSFLNENESVKTTKNDVATHLEGLDPEFFRKIDPDGNLTHGDKRICSYIRLNLKNKEIANITGTTVKAVEARITRIKKKIDLPSETSLRDFIIKY